MMRYVFSSTHIMIGIHSYICVGMPIFRCIRPVFYQCRILCIWLTICDSNLAVERMATRRQSLGCNLIFLLPIFSSSLFRGDCTLPTVCGVWGFNDCNFCYCCLLFVVAMSQNNVKSLLMITLFLLPVI